MTRLVLLLAAAVLTAGVAGAEEIRSIPTPRGVTQHFVFVRPAGVPVATVVLFTGGDGTMRLAGRKQMGAGGNFLVRNRAKSAP